MLVDCFLILKTCAFSARLPDGGLLTSPWREDRTLVRFSGAAERVVAWVETAAHVPFTSTAARSQQRRPPTRHSCPSGTCKHRKKEKKKNQVWGFNDCKLESKLAALSDFWTSTNAERIIEQGLWIFHCDALWPLTLQRPEMKAACVERRMQLNKHWAPTLKRIYQPNASVAAAAALFKRLMATADWYSWDL